MHVAQLSEVDEDVDDDHCGDIDGDSGNLLILRYLPVVSFADFISTIKPKYFSI